MPTSLFVSTLYGEFNFGFIKFPPPVWLLIAYLPVVGFIIAGLVDLPRYFKDKRWVAATAIVMSSLVLFLYFTWRYPQFCNQDARYLSPAFFPFAVLWSLGYEMCVTKTSGIIRLLFRLVALIFKVDPFVKTQFGQK